PPYGRRRRRRYPRRSRRPPASRRGRRRSRSPSTRPPPLLPRPPPPPSPSTTPTSSLRSSSSSSAWGLLSSCSALPTDEKTTASLRVRRVAAVRGAPAAVRRPEPLRDLDRAELRQRHLQRRGNDRRRHQGAGVDDCHPRRAAPHRQR